MQFRLRTLIAGLTIVACFCGLFFATPPFIEIPILAMIAIVSPSVWICGACFGKGAWRPFFLGGICAGIAPHLLLAYFGYILLQGLDSNFWDENFGFGEFGTYERLLVAGFFLFPGFCAIFGAGCGVLVYRWCGDGRVPRIAGERSALRDAYVVLESRLSPIPPEGATS